LSKEYIAMQKEPPPFVWAAPDEKNILTWNFIIMFTPSGRFQPDKKICFSMSDFHPGSWNPAWSVATILTGLLSFMLADEMTTGSVTTTDAEKRVYAARSHSWNLQQKRFKEAFPEYCTPTLRDVPNMAQKERGISPSPSPKTSVSSTAPGSAPASPAPTPAPVPKDKAVTRAPNGGIPSTDGSNGVGQSWAASLRQMVWQKWRWGVILALALVVSRMSSSN
ncbi:Ubiquitin-conjugating enzyme E2 6, partial [Trametes pubescens]